MGWKEPFMEEFLEGVVHLLELPKRFGWQEGQEVDFSQEPTAKMANPHESEHHGCFVGF